MKHTLKDARKMPTVTKEPDVRCQVADTTYEYVLKCSNTFNLLDARGAISVTERVGVIQRIRKLAVGLAQLWMQQQYPSKVEAA